MSFLKLFFLVVAALAISKGAPAQTNCDPSAGLAFICGLTNPKDLVQVPGTQWVIASGLAEGDQSGGHIYLVNAQIARSRYCFLGVSNTNKMLRHTVAAQVSPTR